MEKSAAKAYFWGESAEGFADGVYLTAYPVFLWQFLAGRNAAAAVAFVSLVLSFKFLFEALADVLSSLIADTTRWNRRQVFLMGWLAHVVSLVVLGCFPLWVDSSHVVFFLLIAELFRALGLALIAGTFESWAVSTELKLNPKFSSLEFFSRMRFYERLLLLLGVSLTIVVFNWNLNAFLNRSPGLWRGLWILALTVRILSMGVVAFLTSQSAELDTHRHRAILVPKAKMRSQLGIAFKIALNRKVFPIWFLSCLSYAATLCVSFTWPILSSVGGPEPRSYFLMIGIPVFGWLGAIYSRKISKISSSLEMATRFYFLTYTFLLIAGIMLLVSPNVPKPFAFLPIVFVIVSTFFRNTGVPALTSLFHEQVGERDDLRALIMSFRSASSSLLMALMFFGIQRMAGHLLKAEIFAASFPILFISAGALIALSQVAKLGTK